MSARAVSVWFIDSDDAPMDVRIGLVNDVADAQRLAGALFSDSVLVPIADTDLATAMDTNDSHVYAGSYGSLSVLSCPLFATVHPSTLTKTIASTRESRAATLLFTNPEESIGVFARWENGELRRSLSANPVDLYEDIGLPFIFEGPFWGGEHPLRYAPGVAPEPLALPFHPQQLAEQSNREWLGFRFTHPLAATDYNPANIPVTAFAIHPADYQPTQADLDEYRRPSAQVGAVSEAGPAPSSPTDASSSSPSSSTFEAGVPAAPAEPVEKKPKRGRLARYFGFGAKKIDDSPAPAPAIVAPAESPAPAPPPPAEAAEAMQSPTPPTIPTPTIAPPTIPSDAPDAIALLSGGSSPDSEAVAHPTPPVEPAGPTADAADEVSSSDPAAPDPAATGPDVLDPAAPDPDQGTASDRT